LLLFYTFENFIRTVTDVFEFSRAARHVWLREVGFSGKWKLAVLSPAMTAVESNHRVGGSIDQALIDPGLSTHLFGFAWPHILTPWISVPFVPCNRPLRRVLIKKGTHYTAAVELQHTIINRVSRKRTT